MSDKAFRILVAGSRSWTDSRTIRDVLEPYRGRGAVLVHGDSRGADKIAAAIWSRWNEQVEPHPADWDRWGKTAGPRRTTEMVAQGANVCLTFTVDGSRDTEHALALARNASIPVQEFTQHPRTRDERTRNQTATPTTRNEHQAGPSWQTVTSALEPYKAHNHTKVNPLQWSQYLCPVHEGDGRHHNPSLGVRYDPGQAKTIARCFKGCDDEKVLHRVGLSVRDIFDRLPDRNHQRPPAGYPARPLGTTLRSAPPGYRELTPVEKAIRACGVPEFTQKPDPGKALGKPEVTGQYIYRRPDQHIEGAVIRYETRHEHRRVKDFSQRHWNPKSQQWEDKGFQPIPYRLPELLEAVRDGRDIYVCEGEKDVDRAVACGLVATCNAGGAAAWKPEHAAWLKGARRVIVVADRDKPGFRRAAKVAETLTGLAEQVRVLQPRDGKDLSDHFDAGHDLSDLDPIPYLDQPHQYVRTTPETPRHHRKDRSRSR